MNSLQLWLDTLIWAVYEMNQPKRTQSKSTDNLKLNYILGEMIVKALPVSVNIHIANISDKWCYWGKSWEIDIFFYT